MGVRVVMLTGDAPTTAGIVAHAVGIEGAVQPPGAELSPRSRMTPRCSPGSCRRTNSTSCRRCRQHGHTVGMCGDGANDAPALRQAQIGIAVSTATDVAKSAAGIVLTEPGLGGIVAAVHEGRVTFQRILTYCLRSMTRKTDQMLFLTAGLIMTGPRDPDADADGAADAAPAISWRCRRRPTMCGHRRSRMSGGSTT